jgi:hypothetical protein
VGLAEVVEGYREGLVRRAMGMWGRAGARGAGRREATETTLRCPTQALLEDSGCRFSGVLVFDVCTAAAETLGCRKTFLSFSICLPLCPFISLTFFLPPLLVGRSPWRPPPCSPLPFPPLSSSLLPLHPRPSYHNPPPTLQPQASRSRRQSTAAQAPHRKIALPRLAQIGVPTVSSRITACVNQVRGDSIGDPGCDPSIPYASSEARPRRCNVSCGRCASSRFGKPYTSITCPRFRV